MQCVPKTLQNGLVVHEVRGEPGLLEILGTLCGCTFPPIHYPGPNPVSIDSMDFEKLRAQPYYVTEKSDGIRMGMLVCQYKALDVCVVFDRTLSMYIFGVHKMPRALYQGTVFDGELVRVKGQQWTYMIFDAIVVSGVPTFALPFSQRLAAVGKSLVFYEPTRPTDTGDIAIKTFIPFDCAHLPALYDHLTAAAEAYTTDGIIFMPERPQVVYGRHDFLFKLKEHHSIDFLLKKDKLYIYDEAARRNKMVGSVHPGPHPGTDGDIVECTLDPTSKSWVVVCVRTDKTSSNNKYTYDKTMLNIRENLKLSDIVNAALVKK